MLDLKILIELHDVAVASIITVKCINRQKQTFCTNKHEIHINDEKCINDSESLDEKKAKIITVNEF